MINKVLPLKALILTIMLISSLYASEAMASNDNSIAAKSWRSGFITAYKAMEVETKLQGLGNKPISAKKYVIYFDANRDNISDWDSLMVQMFGYSSSIYKPIRTTNNWLIFGSYNNKATAYQELKMLNHKIFKNSEKYRLKMFKNNKNKVFLSDSAILTNEIKGLKQILKKQNSMILAKEKKDLETKLKQNQKVAIVYLNKNGNQVKNVVLPAKKIRPSTKKSQKKGKLYKVKQKTSKLYSKPFTKKQYYLKTMKIGDRIRIVTSKDGWGKTSKNHYMLMSCFKKPVAKVKKTITNTKVVVAKKPVAKTEQTKKLIAPEEPLNGYIDTALLHFDLYKIKDSSFVYTKKTYKKFVKSGIYKNNFVDVLAYSYKVTDEDGNVFYKIYKKNTFIKKSSKIFFRLK